MRRYVSIWAVLVIMVMVHVDWHLGRGHHHARSLNWPYHWVTGLVTFLLLVFFCAGKTRWPKNPGGPALLNGILGLFAGQIVEPVLEVVAFRLPVATVFSPERWLIFGQFVEGSLGGLIIGLALWFIPHAPHRGEGDYD